MHQPHEKYSHIFSIVRFDLFQYADNRPATPEELDSYMQVVKAYTTEEAAQQEADRLNKLNADKNVRYLVRVTKLLDSA